VGKDWAELIRLWTPESQGIMAGGVAAAMVMIAGDDPSVAELMGKYGIDESVWKASAPAGGNPSEMMQAMMQKSKALAAAVDDKPAFFVEAMKLQEKLQEELLNKMKMPGMDLGKLKEAGMKAQANAKLVDVQIDGETAQGQQAMSMGGREVKMPLEFKKIDGSWLLHKSELDLSPMGALANPMGGQL
jgi:hypothetical protein